jgi:hypothetical protein
MTARGVPSKLNRHIGRDDSDLTLCGIFAPHRLLSEGEAGVARDGCRVCTRLYLTERAQREGERQLLSRIEETLARVDTLLVTPCCGGCCGR